LQLQDRIVQAAELRRPSSFVLRRAIRRIYSLNLPLPMIELRNTKKNTRAQSLWWPLPLLLASLVLHLGSIQPLAAQEPEGGERELIAEFLSSADRDLRGFGLQQVREALPGEAATRWLAGLMPDLPRENQAALLEALGDRADPAARPAVLEALRSPHLIIRSAALQALETLGSADDVPLLAERAGGGGAPEQAAARRALVRLRGDEVTHSIIKTLSKAQPPGQVELLRVLAARKAFEAMPAVLRSARGPDSNVRVAALNAAEVLAGPNHAAPLIEFLETDEPDEFKAAEAALLSLCARHPRECLDPVLAQLKISPAPVRLVLLHSLAVIGGPKALESLARHAEDDNQSAREEASRLISNWPDRAAAPHLLAIARENSSSVGQILGLRGLIRLASADEQRPANLPLLEQAWELSEREEEKRLILGALGSAPVPAALDLAMQAIELPSLKEEAVMAVIMISEKMPSTHKSEVMAAMRAVLRLDLDPTLRERAEKVLSGLP
jgi:HEAT repeat protein